VGIDEDMDMKEYEKMLLQTGDYVKKEAIPQWKIDMMEMERQRGVLSGVSRE
jgi:hypothetical protein